MFGPEEKSILWKTLRWVLVIVIGGPIALVGFTLFSGLPLSHVLAWGYVRGFALMAAAALLMGLFALGPTLVIGAIVQGLVALIRPKKRE